MCGATADESGYPSPSAQKVKRLRDLKNDLPGAANNRRKYFGLGDRDNPSMSGELFKAMAGVNMVHVPYRGGAPALADVIAGQVQVTFSPMPSCIEYIKAGTVRALVHSWARCGTGFFLRGRRRC
jgi:tripartite-type tricarboxylate transporter receptor subunit TctC